LVKKTLKNIVKITSVFNKQPGSNNSSSVPSSSSAKLNGNILDDHTSLKSRLLLSKKNKPITNMISRPQNKQTTIIFNTSEAKAIGDEQKTEKKAIQQKEADLLDEYQKRLIEKISKKVLK
jgi:hypothetical protein